MSRIQRAAGLLLVSLTCAAFAHEHHTDEIPEGEVVSPDPIVRYKVIMVSQVADSFSGQDVMDPHLCSNRRIRRHFPHWDGPWSK